MASLAYRLLNVFTREGEALSGNALCVFEDGANLPEATLQALARQFNLSETTFLLAPTSAAAHARVRIFTPAYELPFAGHPTLGTAAVCHAMGLASGDTVRLQMAAGVISVERSAGRWTLTAPAARWREPEFDPGTLAALLGLEPDDLLPRALWVSTGSEQLIVPLSSAAAVRRALPQPGAMQVIRSGADAGKIYVFAPTAPDQALARFFFPQGDQYLEDPATGSATANLGGWWQAQARPLPTALRLSQGEQVARPSTLHLTIAADGAIRVGGEVIELGRGSVTL